MSSSKPFVLLGEAMGANEVRIGKGFVGASGIELLKMSNDAGLLELSEADWSRIALYWQTSRPQHIDAIWEAHPEAVRMNVFNLHPTANKIETLCGPKTEGITGYPALIKSKFLRAEFQPELERLADDLLHVDPNLVVALGNTPLWALCGVTAISKLRGTTRLSTHCVDGFKVLPTFHPAAVIRQWELRSTAVVDLMKAAREAQFPEIRRPQREIWIEPTLEDIEEFIAKFILTTSGPLSVDIETSGNQITCIGFSPRPDLSLVVPFYDARKAGNSYWPTRELEFSCWKLIRSVLVDRTIRKLFQNGLYDIAFIWRSVGIPVYGAEDDTMLLHHALQPESLKGLGFLGSIYSDESAWKTERKGTTTIKRDA